MVNGLGYCIQYHELEEPVSQAMLFSGEFVLSIQENNKEDFTSKLI